MRREQERSRSSSADGLTRRDFLAVSGTGLAAVTAPHSGTRHSPADRSVIELVLVGGPSQLDTWDPKPLAPAGIRGPFRPIATRTPGIAIAEHFPRMATLSDRFALVRSVYSDGPAIHEAGLQLLHTGHVSSPGSEHPHLGAEAFRDYGARHGVPAWVGMPGPIGQTGVAVSRGQGAGCLGPQFEAFWLNADPATASSLEILARIDRLRREVDLNGPESSAGTGPGSQFSAMGRRAFELSGEPARVRDRYGRHSFGQCCLLARRLVEAGVRVVTVNMFQTVFGTQSWDMHANGLDLPVTLDDYRNLLCPLFDQAYSALIEDLAARGMLDRVLVVAAGEFGRTPRLNGRGGRDHWPGVWSAVLAGGGVRGGRIVGASDEHGAEPKDRPVSVAEIHATVRSVLGLGETGTRSAMWDGLPSPSMGSRRPGQVVPPFRYGVPVPVSAEPLSPPLADGPRPIHELF